MSQPKKPPVSLRLPDATRVAVEQWAAERGVPRNAAYVELLQRGLKLATGSGVPRDTTGPAVPPLEVGDTFTFANDPVVRRVTAVIPKPKPIKSRLKGEWKAP
jgi:hypothetical protein